ncbi:AAA domain-containing protein [Oryzobacter sp. R7]|uniref:AAA domain-containing protein n=1 Tax=Oryzobacter faecalis TaxID=3388656 RepID=UPI00398C8A53
MSETARARDADTPGGATTEPPAAVVEEAPADPRGDRVATARAAWTRHLVDLGGRNTLLWYRDLPTGTLDLRTAHPGGVAMLMTGRPTRLSDLFREPAALDDARRRARAIAAKSRELKEERGILTCFLAIGMATWTVTLPDGRTAPRPPAAPVLLRSCTLRSTGAAQGDHVLDLGRDVELNPVLAHYLASEQGITVDDDALEALASGDGTVDPYPVYAALAQACARVPDFSIDPRLVLGTFSYAKLPMVADLAAQGDHLADHDVVAALAGDPDALRAIRSELDPARLHLDDPGRDVLVLDADSSQHEAVEAVRSGSHLVVHGPPGTGKSQTIANLIAALAADGKRVLFVAEKRAAIDAVVGRLDRVGLSDLVLDLHAGAQGRRRVARELADGLDRLSGAGAGPGAAGVPALPRDRRGRDAGAAARVTRPSDARSVAAVRLADHVRALHAVREPWGVSLHDVQEAVSAFAALPTPPRSRVRLRDVVLRRLDRDALGRAATVTTDLASLADWDGAGRDDPWFGADLPDADTAAEARCRAERLAGERVEGTSRTLVDVFRGIHLPEAPTTRDWGHVLSTVGEVRDTLETFRPEVFDIPLADLVAATGSSAYRREVGVDLGFLERWRLRRQARGLLRPGRPPADLHAALGAASEQRIAWRQLAGSGGRPEIPVELDRARAAHAELVDDLEWLDVRLARAEGEDGRSLLDLDVPTLRSRVEQLAASAGRVGVAPAVRGALDELEAAGLRPLVDDLRGRGVPAESVRPEVEWVWWCSIAEEVATRDPQVAAHDGRALTRSVADFAEADRAVLSENATRVLDAVAVHVGEVVADHPEQESLLRAEAARARRLTPLRDLVTRAPELVTAVRPCWVMSPLVVASVLPPGTWFDVVVFDEASQIPPAEAVSAVSRARQVVVAGDSRQLPPTSFFTTATDGEGAVGADDALTEGVESILDVLAAALPARRLRWHYRSLDERLIAFANAEVYGGSLVTFPGTGTDPVVRHVLVDGHGVVGEGEAAVESTTTEVDRVVELVLDHARTRPERSLGVIALGITHAQRVEAALRRALAGLEDDPALTAFFDEDRPEPFFVKNLERVQGDERDDVLLTIGYGKTPHGRVLHRFGPLNTEGGERRLNVAITRARRSMTVVSSIAAGDLDPERLRARGAVMLRDFLAYAAGQGLPGRAAGEPPGGAAVAGSAAGDGSPEGAGPVRSVVLADLARRLRAEGLVVREGLGSSADPVDLAVEDPRRPGHLLLAVESDGPQYAAMRTVRDRDRLRAEQLERLGWRHLRVWSTDVFRDPARDVSRILDTLGLREAPGD